MCLFVLLITVEVLMTMEVSLFSYLLSVNVWLFFSWVLLYRLERGRSVTILTLCIFEIQCACVHSLAFVCICTMFHIICSIECVGRGIGTIAKMLFICYHQGSSLLEVCADYFYFRCTRFSLTFSTLYILILLHVFS